MTDYKLLLEKVVAHCKQVHPEVLYGDLWDDGIVYGRNAEREDIIELLKREGYDA